MLRLNRLTKHTSKSTRASLLLCQNQKHEEKLFDPYLSDISSKKIQLASSTFTSSPFLKKTSTLNFEYVALLEIFLLANKEAIEKERARLKDEMSRGYFADMKELEKHGGKIAVGSKTIVPAMEAKKFPNLEVNYSDGKSLKLPVGIEDNADSSTIPKACLMCLTFRANSQAMITSWTSPFIGMFHDAKNIQLYEVSFIDSWLLCRSPIKRLLLRIMRKSSHDESSAIQRQIVYSFGDHYYFRKELKILNLLTVYIFLLDKFGRVRWLGTGMATEEELSSLLSCTSVLLEEK